MNYKKMIAFVVSMAMLLPIATTIGVETSNDNTIVANAETSSDNKCGDNATWSFDETTGTLTISGTGAMYDYNNLYGGEGDTDPFAPWFEQINDIKKVIIEDGITYISSGFLGCKNLTEVTIPNSVTHIGYMAFRGCTSLKSVTIPKSVTTIEECAFGFYGEESIIDGGFTIYGYTGSEAENYVNTTNNSYLIGDNRITFVALDDNTTDITSNKCGDNATWSFDETTGTLTISGTGDTYDYDIDTSPFADWDSNMIIKKIIVEDGITSLGAYIFFVGSYSEFEPLYTVESISLPDTLISIGDYAIAGFTDNLKDINLPNNLEEIGEYAFIKWSDANSVNSILNFVVPKSVKTIGKNAIGYLSGDGSTEIVEEDFTITGYTGSQAETYAKENGITFVALDSDTTTNVDPYSDIIKQYCNECASYTYPYTYVLNDVNKDGKLELIVKTGDCEANYQFVVYTYNDDSNVMEVGSFGGAHTVLYGSYTQNSVYTNKCHMSGEAIYKYSMNSNNLTETELFSRELTAEEYNAYGYYDLTLDKDIYEIEEKDITEYTYTESTKIDNTSGSNLTLEEYITKLDALSSNAPKLNNGDTLTLTGTVKSESYQINSENQGTVLILELDTPVTYAFYGDTTGNYTDGQEVLVESVQLSDIDNSYIGKNITVEGEVLFAHTGHHIRDIVLQDCSVVKNNTPVSSNYADAYAQFLKTGDFSIIPNLQEDGTPKFSLIYIDKDDIPELVLTYDYDGNINNNAKSYVFTYYNDEISYVGEFVNMEYIEKQNYITSGTTNSGFDYTWIYSIENGVAVQKAYLYYNGNDDTYYIDDTQVTKDEYLEKIEMLNNVIYNLDRYDINDTNIQEYIYNHDTTTTTTTTTDSTTTNDTTTIKDSKDSADTSDKGILPIVMATLLTGGVALVTVKKRD